MMINCLTHLVIYMYYNDYFSCFWQCFCPAFNTASTFLGVELLSRSPILQTWSWMCELMAEDTKKVYMSPAPTNVRLTKFYYADSKLAFIFIFRKWRTLHAGSDRKKIQHMHDVNARPMLLKSSIRMRCGPRPGQKIGYGNLITLSCPSF